MTACGALRRPRPASMLGMPIQTLARMPCWSAVRQTIRTDMSGSPAILQSSTSPFTTGPTFSGVPE